MYRTAFAVLVLLVLYTATAPNASAQDPKPDNEIRVVSVGEITKIDAETRSFELKSRVPEATSSGSRSGGWAAEIHVGIGIGGGSRQPEMRDPVNTPRLPIPAAPPPNRSARYVTTKVSTTERTVLTQDGKKIAFEILKVGNRVTVTGIPQGEDVEATQIKRQRPILD